MWSACSESENSSLQESSAHHSINHCLSEFKRSRVVLWGDTMGPCLFVIFLASGYLPLGASVGCMDFRTYAYKCNEEGDICCNPYDYKQWHYVYCACPCNEYDHRDKKRKCLNCWHYHDPAEQIVITAREQGDQTPRPELVTSKRHRCR